MSGGQEGSIRRANSHHIHLRLSSNDLDLEPPASLGFSDERLSIIVRCVMCRWSGVLPVSRAKEVKFELANEGAALANLKFSSPT